MAASCSIMMLLLPSRPDLTLVGSLRYQVGHSCFVGLFDLVISFRLIKTHSNVVDIAEKTPFLTGIRRKYFTPHGVFYRL